jgi:hypothetical protein
MSNKAETTQNPPSVCLFPHISAEALISLAPLQGYETMSPIRIFLVKYHAYLCILHCLDPGTNRLFHVSTITDYLRDELKHDLNTDHIIGTHNCQREDMDIISRFSDLGNGIMVAMNNIYLHSAVQNPNQLKSDSSDGSFSTGSEVNIYYLPEHRSYVQDLANRFSKMTVLPLEPCTTFTLQMVCQNSNGYYLSSILIKKPLITDLALHYGNNFVSIHEKIIKNLNKKDEKGIVLLHGIPGSGKFKGRNDIFHFLI